MGYQTRKVLYKLMNKISKYGFLIFLSFFLFLILYRILLPFGDEPDFMYRGPHLIEFTHPIWSPAYYMDYFLSKLRLDSNCKIISSATSIYSHIDFKTCTQSLYQIFLRVFITIIFILPIILIILFPKVFIDFLNIFDKDLDYLEMQLKIKSLTLSLIFPGMIYYISIIGIEQLTLILSLLIVLTIDILWISILLFFLLAYYDLGNALVVGFFIFHYKVSYILYKKNYIKLVYILMVFLVLIAYVVGYQLLYFFQSIPLIDVKVNLMLDKFGKVDFREKYPLVLRPIITYMTSILTLPSGVKSVVAIIFSSLMLSLFFFKVIVYKPYIKLTPNLNIIYKKSILILSSGITSILFFVFLFPDYANAKYYIFLLPLVFNILILFENLLKLYLIVTIIDLLVLLELLLDHY